MSKGKLRLRPPNIRFFVLGVSCKDVSVSSAHKSLELAIQKGAHILYIADIKTGKIIKETNPKNFLDWWETHYNDIETEYEGGSDVRGECK